MLRPLNHAVVGSLPGLLESSEYQFQWPNFCWNTNNEESDHFSSQQMTAWCLKWNFVQSSEQNKEGVGVVTVGRFGEAVQG